MQLAMISCVQDRLCSCENAEEQGVVEQEDRLLLPLSIYRVFPALRMGDPGAGLQGSSAVVEVGRLSIKSEAVVLGLIQYSAEWDDIMPRSDRWMDLSVPYTRSEQVFRCPATKEGEYGFAFMDRLSGKAAAKLEKPDNQLMIVESSDLRRNAHRGEGSILRKPRHRNVYYGFADGHVMAKKH